MASAFFKVLNEASFLMNSRNTRPSRSKPSDRGTQTPSSKSRTEQRATKSTKPVNFEIDPELLSPEYNQSRKPRLPHGIVVNDNPAGILIPVGQLEASGWLNVPEELETVTLGENEVTGILITQARLLVLDFVPEYIRYKDDTALDTYDENTNLALSVVGPYDTYKHLLDKNTMHVCSEHAFVFLSEDNQPLHTTPVVIRFKNVALWSFRSETDSYYRNLEKAFAAYTGQPFSGKSNRWRSLGVLPVEFKAAKEGEGKNKSWCCKAVTTEKPTVDNLPELFPGTPQFKSMVWNFQLEIAGLVDPRPALPEGDFTVAAPPSRSTKVSNPGRTATDDDLEIDDEFEPEDRDEDLIDVDAESVDVDGLSDDDLFDDEEE
jgi:hypothetical protein